MFIFSHLFHIMQANTNIRASLHSRNIGKIKSRHRLCLFNEPCLPQKCRFRCFDTCRLKSIKIESNRNSIEVDNHKKLRDRFLSTSDICRLISIHFNRFFIDYRNYRFVTPCQKNNGHLCTGMQSPHM